MIGFQWITKLSRTAFAHKKLRTRAKGQVTGKHFSEPYLGAGITSGNFLKVGSIRKPIMFLLAYQYLSVTVFFKVRVMIKVKEPSFLTIDD